MGTITAVNMSNLFWLGRYTERVFTTLNIFFEYADRMVDEDENIYRKFLSKMSVPDIYNDITDFLERYVFDLSDMNSIASNLDRALGNGIVLRETITTHSLSYLQMSFDSLKKIDDRNKLRYDLLPVCDYIYAFWGCIDDKMKDIEALRVVHLGKAVERTDMYLRMGYSIEKVDAEVKNLLKHISRYNTSNYSFINTDAFYRLVNMEVTKENYAHILADVEQLIEVNFD